MSKHDNAPENPLARRTQGRSEVRETLEEQLQKALEDSFPASDPPAVVSTAIAGRCKKKDEFGNCISSDEESAR